MFNRTNYAAEKDEVVIFTRSEVINDLDMMKRAQCQANSHREMRAVRGPPAEKH
jgi:hypothetical protein